MSRSNGAREADCSSDLWPLPADAGCAQESGSGRASCAEYPVPVCVDPWPSC